MIVSGICVCSSFLNSVCMFIVSKALLISSATVIVCAWEPFGCDDVCMCVVNNQFELVSESVYVDFQYDEISLIFTAGSVWLCGVCSPVVVLGLFVRLSWYPMSWVQLLRWL